MSKEVKYNGVLAPIRIRRALSIIIPLCLISLIIGGATVSIANDVYAFVKPDKSVTVHVNESLDTKEFSRLLQQNGIIRNAFVFEYYLNSHGLSEKTEALFGEITLNCRMSYRELADKIF